MVLKFELFKMDRGTKHLELNEKKWDRWAGSLDNESRRNQFLRDGQRKVVSLLNLKENSTFLDIGCGTGWAVRLAAESINYQGAFYGVDMSSKMIEKARENYKGNENFHFVKADSSSIPLDSDFFDAIICTHSFHHYLDAQKVMIEIHRLLKPGGRVYILDPTTDTLFGKMVDKIVKMFEPEHVRMYSTEEFKAMFAGAGLKHIHTEIVKSFDKIHIAEK